MSQNKISAGEAKKLLERAKKKFKQLDVNGNGSLQGAEISKLADWVYDSFNPDGKVMSESERDSGSKELMKKLDANNDGQLDFDEFSAWFTETCKQISTFRQNKAQKDKTVSKKEDKQEEKMKPKILMVAASGAKAREIVQNRFNFRCSEPCITYVGCKNPPRSKFCAIMGVYSTPLECDQVCKLIESQYKDVPIRADVSSKGCGKAQFKEISQAEKFFVEDKIPKAMTMIKTVFQQYDKDKSGTIDKSELRVVATQMGVDMDEAAIHNMMQDLDTNRDGVISLMEFSMWWLSGRQGMTGSTTKMFASIVKDRGSRLNGGTWKQEILTLAGQQKGAKPNGKKKCSKLEYNFNGMKESKPDDLKACWSVKVQRDLSKEKAALREIVHGKEDVPTDIYFHLAIKMKASYSDDGLIKTLMDSIPERLPFDICFKDSCYHVTMGIPAEDMQNDESMDFISQLFAQRPADDYQSMEGGMKFSFNLEDLFAEGAEPIMNFMAKGMQSMIALNAWADFSKVLIGLFEGMTQGDAAKARLFQQFMPIMPAYMFNISGKFQCKTDPADVLQNKCDKILGLQFPDAKDAPKIHMNARTFVERAANVMFQQPHFDDMDIIREEDGFWHFIDDNTTISSCEEACDLMKRWMKKYPMQFLEQLQPGCEDNLFGTFLHWLSMNVDDDLKVEICGKLTDCVDFQVMGNLCSKGLGNLMKVRMNQFSGSFAANPAQKRRKAYPDMADLAKEMAKPLEKKQGMKKSMAKPAKFAELPTKDIFKQSPIGAWEQTNMFLINFKPERFRNFVLDVIDFFPIGLQVVPSNNILFANLGRVVSEAGFDLTLETDLWGPIVSSSLMRDFVPDFYKSTLYGTCIDVRYLLALGALFNPYKKVESAKTFFTCIQIQSGFIGKGYFISRTNRDGLVKLSDCPCIEECVFRSMEIAGRITPQWCETGNFNEDAAYGRRQKLLQHAFKKRARPLVDQWMDNVWGSDTQLDIDTFIARVDKPDCRWVFSDPECIRQKLMTKLQDVEKVEITENMSVQDYRNAVHTLFKRNDVNLDGGLQMDEFHGWIEEIFDAFKTKEAEQARAKGQGKPSFQEIKSLFDQFDNNSDGKISWKECWTAAAPFQPKAPSIPEKSLTDKDAAFLDGYIGLLCNPVVQSFKNPPYNFGNPKLFKDETITSLDGTKLKAWKFMCPGSKKIAIFAHDLGANKEGFCGKESNNPLMTVDNDYNCLYKNLVEGGFNVLAYDFRGHGQSDAPHDGTVGNGGTEWQDVCAVQEHVCKQKGEKYQIINIAFGMGCLATVKAMAMKPEVFESSCALMMVNPRNGSTQINQVCKYLRANASMTLDFTEKDVDTRFKNWTGSSLYDQDITPFLKSICVPVFMSAVRNDFLTTETHTNDIYSMIPGIKEPLCWIEGPKADGSGKEYDHRCEGYNYWNDHSECMLNVLRMYTNVAAMKVTMSMSANRPKPKMFERSLCKSDEAIVSAFSKNVTCVDNMCCSTKTPKDYGLTFQSKTIESFDGTKLSAWEIPSPHGSKLAIFAHPLGNCKAGYSANPNHPVMNISVDYCRLYKILVSEGYHVLAYDFRGHGQSGAPETGCISSGHHEWQDAAAVQRYALKQAKWKGLKIANIGYDMGANATIKAASRCPALFSQTACFFAVQPMNVKVFFNTISKDMGGKDVTERDMDARLCNKFGFSLNDLSPNCFLKDIRAPIMYSQVKGDAMTHPSDVQSICDMTPGEKCLHWIEGKKSSGEGEYCKRYDGFNYWSDCPKEMVSFLNKHCEGTYTSRPTQQDILNSIILTLEFKLADGSKAGDIREYMKEGTKPWADLKGLRSKWFWFDEATMTTGGIYTFYHRKHLMAYMQSAQFSEMQKTPMAAPGTIKFAINENLGGGELTHERAMWPHSKDKGPVNRKDLQDAWILQTRYEMDFTCDSDMPNVDCMRKSFLDGGRCKRFADIPGLRCKDFTYIDDKDQVGRSFYVFTSRKCMDDFMQTPLWKLCQKNPTLKNFTYRCMEVLQGSEHTAELGKWPHCARLCNPPPTQADVLKSCLFTYSAKIDGDAAKARSTINAIAGQERCVKGLRSKYNWLDEKTMTMGGVYTFFDHTCAKEHSESALFKSITTCPVVDERSFKLTFHEVQAGTEECSMMADWPYSGDGNRTCVNYMDLKDAVMLIWSDAFAPEQRYVNKGLLADRVAGSFVGIPGVRQVDHTHTCDEQGNYRMHMFMLCTNQQALKDFFASPLFEYVAKFHPDGVAMSGEVLQGSCQTAELGRWPQAQPFKSLRPTREDICNSCILTTQYKLPEKEDKRSQWQLHRITLVEEAKKMADIKGLRSNYHYANESTGAIGTVMTFYNRESLENFQKTPLFLTQKESKLQFVVDQYEVLAGSERLNQMPDAQWPASQGRTPVCADDLKDAQILMTKMKIVINKSVPDVAACKAMVEKDASKMWVGTVPGLRTMNITMKSGDQEHLYQHYVFTSKKCLEDYLASDLYMQMNLETDQNWTGGVEVQVFQGSEHTVELGQWPLAHHCRPIFYNNVNLEYLKAYGRTEATRLMLAYVGQPFKNTFFDKETTWPAAKGKAPYQTGGLPHAVIDGMRYQETNPIMRMIAIRFGLYSNDPVCSHQNDYIMDTCNDLIGNFPKLVGAADAKAYQVCEDDLHDKLTKFCDSLEAKMIKENWCQVAGNKVMAADFWVGAFYRCAINKCRPNPMWTFNDRIMSVFEAHPKVHCAVKALMPNLKTYLANEFESPI